MRLAVFSDLHGNSIVFKTMLSVLGTSRIDAFICCGDIAGYYYGVSQITEILRQLPQLYIVKGNHDAMYCRAEKDSAFRMGLCEKYGNAYKTIDAAVCRYLLKLPEKIVLSMDGKRILIVHGSEQSPLRGRWYPDSDIDIDDTKYDVIFCGHTHYSMVRRQGDTQIINPGSLGQPRDGKGFAYGVFDTKTGIWNAYTVKANIDFLLRQIEENDNGNPYLRSVLLRGRNSEHA